ncbi:hypothetical protein CK203_052781 [Vitis vinifera]|uniref:Uncharacterized protein n=1 Tax=Vitis vinifera TaxID=29760 RepID=A0A438FUT5_VITVI|nr:hypothetical protein CK203_052781 [Vitis vinifera]
MVVAKEATRLKKIMEQERVFEFLTSLNPELNQEATPESSALATTGNFKLMDQMNLDGTPWQPQLGSKGGSNREGKLVTRSGQVHQAATIDVSHENIPTTEPEPILLSKEHYEKLKTLLNQLDKGVKIPTAKTAHALSSKQDQNSGRMIEHGERKGGLYYLNTQWKICDSIPQALITTTIPQKLIKYGYGTNG